MLGQILKIIKLLGLGRAIRMKRHHDKGLTYIRGYAATCCWWSLLNNGFLDELAKEEYIDWREYVARRSLREHVMEAIIEYLTGIGLLECSGDSVRMSADGVAIFQEPRGLFELLWAYEPCFGELGNLLSGAKEYGCDISRDVTYVGIGSGRLCEQLPYPVMRQMVLNHGCKHVLDLGCGDMAFLSGLCRLNGDICCQGIDCSKEMIDFNTKQLEREDYGGRLITSQADMFNLPTDLPEVDCITACDTFHEYLDDPERIVELLKGLRERFGDVLMVIGEFCLQDPVWLAKHRTASLEHHLFHQLSNQQIGSAEQWRDIFSRAKLEIVQEQVYDMIGHGYFALR